jgi:hypothetical protein
MKKFALLGVLCTIVLGGLWFLFAFNWSYSTGERSGYVQKLSQKGWLCKTWEGELAMVTMPGTTAEKFLFTVWDPQVVAEINQAMGRRVSLHYEQKVGLPTSCFGETRYWVNKVMVVPELGPSIIMPVPSSMMPAPQPAAPQPAAPQPAASPSSPPTQPATPTPVPPAAPAPASK